MFIRFPKDDQYYSWTRHIKNKMLFYGLSESRIKNVLKNPKRKEEGIAPKTVAVMKRNDRGEKKEEIWVMFQTQRNRKQGLGNRDKEIKKTMISAWRYPGISKPGKTIPIPDDIKEELGILL